MRKKNKQALEHCLRHGSKQSRSPVAKNASMFLFLMCTKSGKSHQASISFCFWLEALPVLQAAVWTAPQSCMLHIIVGQDLQYHYMWNTIMQYELRTENTKEQLSHR